MRRLALLVLLVAAAISAATFACNVQTDCPAGTITPGGSCSNNQLQCPYDLTTPPSTCSGPATVIATTCVCTSGTWQCPGPFECDGGAEDASSAEDAASEAATDSGAVDAALDARADGS